VYRWIRNWSLRIAGTTKRGRLDNRRGTSKFPHEFKTNGSRDFHEHKKCSESLIQPTRRVILK
jgi:hypothetical protein